MLVVHEWYLRTVRESAVLRVLSLQISLLPELYFNKLASMGKRKGTIWKSEMMQQNPENAKKT